MRTGCRRKIENMPGSTVSYRKVSMLKSKMLIFFRDLISLFERNCLSSFFRYTLLNC